MLKWLLLIASFLITEVAMLNVCSPVHRQSKQEQCDTSQQGDPGQKISLTTAPLRSYVVEEPGNIQKGEEQRSTNANGYFSELFSPNNIPNITLVGVGLITLIFVGQQARAASHAVAVAVRQLDLLERKERARLSVVFAWEDFIPPSQWNRPENVEKAHGMAVAISNDGLTKAYSVSVFAAKVLSDSEAFPSLGEAVPVSHVPPTIGPDKPAVVVEIPRGRRPPTPSDGPQIQNGSVYLHLFGYIVFFDVFDTLQCQSFRWVWDPKTFPTTLAGQMITIDQSKWKRLNPTDDAEFCNTQKSEQHNQKKPLPKAWVS